MLAAMKDVSRNASFDLLCVNGTTELHVEVKGTQGDGTSVLLTANEVRHARALHPGVALFTTSQIVVENVGDTTTATGGTERVLLPWDLADSILVPLQFACRLQMDE
jgi:hypothetical protein